MAQQYTNIVKATNQKLLEHQNLTKVDDNTKTAFSVGDKVKTDSGEVGSISHVQHSNDPKYPHGYRVTTDDGKATRLESGNYISHNRLKRIKE